MPGNVSSVADSNVFVQCPACSASPLSRTDKYCRQCGYRFILACRVCREMIRPYDRFCPSCGARRLIIFDQINYCLQVYYPHVALALAIVLAGAWLSLRYALRDKLK